MASQRPQWISVARTETTERSGKSGCGSAERAAMDLGREDRDDAGPFRVCQFDSVAAMDLGREDRDDLPLFSGRGDPRGAAMDLGREDRDDASRATGNTASAMPQWISVARTETTR